MAAVSETIVREYLELHGFFIHQQRKYVPRSRQEEEEIDFLALNPNARPTETPLPFVLSSGDLASVARAVVVVKGWHSETFSAAVLSGNPAIFSFVEPAVFKSAARAFGKDGAMKKILALPALPATESARTQSIELLRGKGIDAVILFRTMLADLIAHTEINRNYQRSDLLQVIRILKKYDFFKEPQLELFKPKRQRRTSHKDSLSA